MAHRGPLDILWRDARGPETREPLVILLHGGGGDERTMGAVAGYIPKAFAVASLRGPLTEGRGFAWYARDEREGWPRPASFQAALTAIAQTIDGFATRRIALAGFSSGAVVAAGFALAYPARVKALALLSGLLPQGPGFATDPGRLGGIDVFVARGTDDTLLRPGLVQHSEDYLRRRSGANVTERTYPFGHVMDESELADLSAWLACSFAPAAAA